VFGRPPPLRPAFRQAAGGHPWRPWRRCGGSAAHPCQPKHIDAPKQRRRRLFVKLCSRKDTSWPARSCCSAARARCAQQHHKATIAKLRAACWCALIHARLATSSSVVASAEASKALLRRAQRPPAASRTPARLQRVTAARVTTCSAAARGAQRAQLLARCRHPPHAPPTAARPLRRAERAAAATRMPVPLQDLMTARRDVWCCGAAHVLHAAARHACSHPHTQAAHPLRRTQRAATPPSTSVHVQDLMTACCDVRRDGAALVLRAATRRTRAPHARKRARPLRCEQRAAAPPLTPVRLQ
jgi:hypothetical protein